MISDIINIHKNFILKPNPYVTQQQAEDAYTKFAAGQFLTISAVGCFTLSLLKFVPKISQRAFFKKFTVFQAISGVAAYGWYFYEINQIGNTIPKEELQRQKQIVEIKKTQN